jgi:enterochelin esterase-like enzyme
VSGLKAEQPELRRLAADLRDRRQEMLSAAIADPVDPAALEAAMAAVREATAAMQSAAHAAMLKTVAEPSASEP